MKIILTLLGTLLLFVSCKNESGDQSANAQSQTESQTPAEIKSIAATDIPNLLNENTLLIDVRTTDEYSQGFIQGTKNFIDYNSPSFEAQIDVLDKEKTYIVYCRSGNRSSKALKMMQGKGFKNLYEVDGGIKNTPANMITLKK